MKSVTITYEQLAKAWLDNEAMLPMPKDCRGFEMLCTAIGLSAPAKKKVKLLAWLSPYGDLIWRAESTKSMQNAPFWQRVPSEDREVEVSDE